MFKHWRYIFRNVGRNPVRTVLPVFGVAVAVFIVTYLFAIFDSRNEVIANQVETLLVVNEKDIY